MNVSVGACACVCHIRVCVHVCVFVHIHAHMVSMHVVCMCTWAHSFWLHLSTRPAVVGVVSTGDMCGCYSLRSLSLPLPHKTTRAIDVGMNLSSNSLWFCVDTSSQKHAGQVWLYAHTCLFGIENSFLTKQFRNQITFKGLSLYTHIHAYTHTPHISLQSCEWECQCRTGTHILPKMVLSWNNTICFQPK